MPPNLDSFVITTRCEYFTIRVPSDTVEYSGVEHKFLPSGSRKDTQYAQ